MDLLIAILWYLSLLMPGQTYNYTNVQAIADQNQPIVTTVESNAIMTQKAQDYYNNTFSSSNVSIIEWWDENPIKPKHD